MPSTISLERIEASLRASGRLQREVVTLPAFELFISPHALDHLTFAAPISPSPPDWAPHVAALKAAFRSRGKRPRLEFLAELHPQLALALQEAGLVCEMRAPLMALELAALPPDLGAAPHLRYLPLTAGDESLLRAYLLQQSVAYGGQPDESAFDWLDGLRTGLQQSVVMGAALEQDGELVAGAVIMIGAGVGELAGVWTAPAHRRRGLAYLLCRRLLAAYAAAGYTFAWLSAAEGAQRLYHKLGFTTIGTQLNYGAPASPSLL